MSPSKPIASGASVVMADIDLKSFGKAVQYRSHVMPDIFGERAVTADDYYEDPSAFEGDAG